MRAPGPARSGRLVVLWQEARTAALVQVMAETLAKANEHTQNVFSAGLLTGRQVHELAQRAGVSGVVV